jgi:hypothetical protein
MNILTSNYYGDIRVGLFGLMLTLTSAFTCAWRDLTIHIGKFDVLWLQLSFWDSPSYSIKPKYAGVRLRVVVSGRGLFHHTILPLFRWHWCRKAYIGRVLSRWNQLVWWFAKTFVDRRYSKLWDAYTKQNRNRWAGKSGNELLEFKPFAIPAVTVPVNLTAKLRGQISTGRGCIEFQLVGEPTDARWRKSWLENGSNYPYCNMSLWVVNGISDIKDGAQITGYSGELWPSAWPEYFSAPKVQHKDNQGAVYLTAKGADLLLAQIN